MKKIFDSSVSLVHILNICWQTNPPWNVWGLDSTWVKGDLEQSVKRLR